MQVKELESLMQSAQVIRFLAENVDLFKEYGRLLAELRRDYYLSCLKAGFTVDESIKLASMYFPGGPPAQQAQYETRKG